MRRLIFMGCLCCLVLFYSCQKKQEGTAEVPSNAINPEAIKNPATASANGNTDEILPVFKFVAESFDFGTIKEGESVAHDFKFKNTGKSDLIISSAHGSCGCTVPDYSKDPIAPGEEGVIKVTFNSHGKEGKQDKTVTIVANTIPNSKVLTITGDVKEK